VANPPQPSTGERERAGCATADLEAVRPSGSGHRCHEGPPHAADELASLGDEVVAHMDRKNADNEEHA
jgi:hypothetical protein